jgi:hypothetical protein
MDWQLGSLARERADELRREADQVRLARVAQQAARVARQVALATRGPLPADERRSAPGADFRTRKPTERITRSTSSG